MPKIRVLVVDDSVVIRQMLFEVLSAHPMIEVTGRASNGLLALAKVTQINPDVVILDIEMPEMDGLEALKQLRQTHPKLPVIMFSTLTRLGAQATFDALSLGATDYVPKPDASHGGKEHLQEWVKQELIPKIISFGARFADIDLHQYEKSQQKISDIKIHAPRDVPTAKIDVVAIGISTGGPNALATVLSALPANFPVPILIVQHMPPIFTRLLAERLSKQSMIKVLEAENGDIIEAGKAYIAPGGYHMILGRTERFGIHIQINQDPMENSCRPSVDVLFRSVARLYGARTLGIIMTGMGADGLRGCELIYEAGGQILAQDEATSVVWGMPGFVVKTGLADKVLPLKDIATEITARVNEKRGLSLT
jgi:two-component system chemotaxis response regulator CheB